MGRFLDQRSSMNAGTAIDIPLVGSSMFGVIGLQTAGVAGNGLGTNGSLIVDLSGTIGLGTLVGGSAIINIVRGTTGTVIYTAIVTLETPLTSELVSFNAQDLLAPAAVETPYAAYVSLFTGSITRVGPESFWGIASQG